MFDILFVTLALTPFPAKPLTAMAPLTVPAAAGKFDFMNVDNVMKFLAAQ